MRTQSTGDSEDRERSLLRAALDGLARRPGMYGTPGIAEGIAVHLTHVFLSVGCDKWRLEDTVTFWKGLAVDLGFGDHCARDEESRRVMRWQMWGSDERLARSQVATGFARIWGVLKPRCLDAPNARRWIEALLREPELGGPPDVLDGVLFRLMLLVCPNDNNVLRNMYEAECAKVRGRGTRSLVEVGTRAAFRARTPKRYPTESGEEDVVAGIHEALRRIDAMGQGVERLSSSQ